MSDDLLPGEYRIDPDSAIYHPVTDEDLQDPVFIERLEEAFEGELAGMLSDEGRLTGGYTWDDILDQLESLFQLPDGRWVTLDFGGEYDSPLWRKIKRIGQRVAKEIMS